MRVSNLTLLLAVALQGCYNHPAIALGTPPNARVAVRLDGPVDLAASDSSGAPRRWINVSGVEGRLVRVTPDSLWLTVRHYWQGRYADQRQSGHDAMLVLPRTAVWRAVTRQFSWTKTLALGVFVGGPVGLVVVVNVFDLGPLYTF